MALFAHVLGEVVEAAGGFACACAAFPAAEGLVARPGTGGGPGGAVDVEDTGFDVVQEPLHFVIVLAEEASGEAKVYVVGFVHGGFVVIIFGQGDDGQEHLLFP